MTHAGRALCWVLICSSSLETMNFNAFLLHNASLTKQNKIQIWNSLNYEHQVMTQRRKNWFLKTHRMAQGVKITWTRKVDTFLRWSPWSWITYTQKKHSQWGEKHSNFNASLHAKVKHTPGLIQGPAPLYHYSRTLSWGPLVSCYSWILFSNLAQLSSFSYHCVAVYECAHNLLSQHQSPRHLHQQKDLP